MKKIILLLLLFLPHWLMSQGVAINETGTDPVASAMLDITSTTKGMLVPRMTTAQRTSIASPAEGLMVYQTDGTVGFYYFGTGAWQSFATTASNGLSIGVGGAVELGGTLSGNTTLDLNSNALNFSEGLVTLIRGSGDDVFIHYDGQNNGVSWAAGVDDSNNADFIISNAGDLSDPKLFIGGAGGAYNGRIGLGTTTPAAPLHMNGAASEMLRLESTGQPFITFYQNGVYEQFIQSFSDDLYLGSFVGSVFLGSTTGVLRSPTANAFEVSGNASKSVAGDWLANSDRRIKTDIQDIDNSLELIKTLRPVKFKYTDYWKEKNESIKDHFYYNFIAQEYQKIFPHAVQGSGEYIEGDDEEILQIDTYNAQIVGLKAIQELIYKIEVLETKVQQLENENTILKENSVAKNDFDRLKSELVYIKQILDIKTSIKDK